MSFKNNLEQPSPLFWADSVSEDSTKSDGGESFQREEEERERALIEIEAREKEHLRVPKVSMHLGVGMRNLRATLPWGKKNDKPGSFSPLSTAFDSEDNYLSTDFAHVLTANPDNFGFNSHSDPLQLVSLGSLEGEECSPSESQRIKMKLADTLQLESICLGLANFHMPEKIDEGVNECFFLKDEHGNNAGIFKLEEVQNRKSCISCFAEDDINAEEGELGFRKGIPANNSAIREVAAYLLDHEGFARVPPTAMVQLDAKYLAVAAKTRPRTRTQDVAPETDFLKSPRHVTQRKGSFQKYVDHHESAEDVGSSLFEVEDVHAIGVFDVRTINLDRHEGNVLVQLRTPGRFSDGCQLIPIDHGLILPDMKFLEDDIAFCWENWPQSKQKFSTVTKEYIGGLDVEENCRMLKENMGRKLSPGSLDSLRLGTMVLQKAVLEHDLTLFDLAQLYRARSVGSVSVISMLLKQAKEKVEPCHVLREFGGLLDTWLVESG